MKKKTQKNYLITSLAFTISLLLSVASIEGAWRYIQGEALLSAYVPNVGPFFGLIFVLMSGLTYFGILTEGAKSCQRTLEAVKIIEHSQQDLDRSVFEIFNEICRAAGITAPELYVIPGNEVNGFLVGTHKDNCGVFITHGALKYLSLNQLKALFAYSLAPLELKLYKYQTYVSCLLYGLLFTFNIGQGMLKQFSIGKYDPRKSMRNKGGPYFIIGLLPFISGIPSWLAAQLFRLTLPKKNIYRCDRYAAEVIRNKEPLIHLLEKLKIYTQTNLPPAVVPFLYTGFHEDRYWTAIFRSHPTINQRIKKLKKYKLKLYSSTWV